MDLALVTGALHLILGAGYIFGLGALTFLDLRHLGAGVPGAVKRYAWGLILVGLTCGAHHVAHGAHLLSGESPYRILDLVSAGVAIPPALLWILLRTRAFLGFTGDRLARVPCETVAGIDFAAGAYVAGIFMVMAMWFDGAQDISEAIPQIAVLAGSWLISAVLWRTQRRRICEDGYLSVSGASLALIFLTCGVSHSVYAYRLLDRSFQTDWHMLIIDAVAAPVAFWFLWNVYRLRRTEADLELEVPA